LVGDDAVAEEAIEADCERLSELEVNARQSKAIERRLR
jgi:hypothetical protein